MNPKLDELVNEFLLLVAEGKFDQADKVYQRYKEIKRELENQKEEKNVLNT